MSKPIENVDDFLNEVIATRAGDPVRRRDTMSISRIQFIREIFPAIFSAGQQSEKKNVTK